MYNYYVALDPSSIFYGISDIYLVSTVTVILAVIIAFYCRNFLKDNSNEEVLHQQHQESEQNESSSSDSSEIDAFTSSTVDAGLVSKLKSSRLKELEAQLTHDQLEEERRIEREQLAAIFELLKKQEADLNMKEIDETELNAQLNLYR